ncbi:hypothetical protein BKA69DRAFT_1044557 [Paraphysoderma sedebokerense]|nr:hypothetical protein BKA69DRAFT_1044557 [Paraphysoderma sedebokerense]
MTHPSSLLSPSKVPPPLFMYNHPQHTPRQEQPSASSTKKRPRSPSSESSSSASSNVDRGSNNPSIDSVESSQHTLNVTTNDMQFEEYSIQHRFKRIRMRGSFDASDESGLYSQWHNINQNQQANSQATQQSLSSVQQNVQQLQPIWISTRSAPQDTEQIDATIQNLHNIPDHQYAEINGLLASLHRSSSAHSLNLYSHPNSPLNHSDGTDLNEEELNLQRYSVANQLLRELHIRRAQARGLGLPDMD